ncbi:MAG: efflux RND transporter periplasmic adaptor subunit [Gemmatimonadota bacterium]
MKIPSKLIGFGVVLLILAVGGFGIYNRIKGEDAADATANAEEGSDAPLPSVSANSLFDDALPVDVQGVPVVFDTLVRTVDATGLAAPWRESVVAAQVSGRILQVGVREGQRVGANTPLVVIDSTDYVMDLREREAALARAQTQYMAQLIGSQNYDPETRAAAEQAARNSVGLPGAEIAIQRARLNLARTRVLPAFAGTVADLQVVEGQHASAGTPIATIQQTDPMKVQAAVLESAISEIHPGRMAEVTFVAFPGEVFAARIESINPVVSQANTARVTLSVRNPDGRIVSGMNANVRLPASRIPDVVMIPREAVVERDIERRTLVFLFEGEGDIGRAKWQYVTLHRRNNTHYEIIDDPNDPRDRLLEPGEIVLVSGHKNLEHDAKVRLGGGVRTVDGVVTGNR